MTAHTDVRLAVSADRHTLGVRGPTRNRGDSPRAVNTEPLSASARVFMVVFTHLLEEVWTFPARAGLLTHRIALCIV